MALAKKYWVELLVFGAVAGVLFTCLIPDITWMNTDCDGPHYIYSAKYLYPAHKTSAPLFLLLGNLFLRLPFGTEAWNFALLSVLASMVTCVFIYLIVKGKTNNRWMAIAGSLVFGSSALVISQSTIIETYALVTMFSVLAYYFIEKRKFVLTAIMLGAGIATHHLIGIPIAIFLILYKDFRHWKYLGVMASFLLFYLYIPVTKAINNPPDMWGNMTLTEFIGDSVSTAQMLIGGLSIWDLPKRMLDAFGILGVSLGIALIPIVWFHKTRHNVPNPIRKKHFKEPLLWLLFLPIVYYMTDLAPQTYVYMLPSIAFGAIIAGIGLSKMKLQWTWVVIGVSSAMLVFNANYFDVGRTLDPELSARKYYNEELPKVQDGQILLAQQGWEWAIVYPYNKDEGREIIPICAGTLASNKYQNSMKDLGVRFIVPEEEMQLVELQDYIMRSIIANNENVWITLPTDTRTYGAEIVPAIGNEDKLLQVPQGIADGSRDMMWQVKPSNPYDIITGAIEVDEWIYIVFSNYTILTFTMMGTIGLVPIWIGWMFFKKRKKWSIKKVREGLSLSKIIE